MPVRARAGSKTQDFSSSSPRERPNAAAPSGWRDLEQSLGSHLAAGGPAAPEHSHPRVILRCLNGPFRFSSAGRARELLAVLFLPSAALTLTQTTAAAPLLPLAEGSGSTAGLEGALGNPSIKPRAPRAWTGMGLGTDLRPWGMLVSASSIQGQPELWSCLHDTLKQSSHCTWSSEFQSPIKLPPRTVKTLSKLVTNVKYPAPALLRGEELKQHFPHASSPTEFGFFQLLPSPSPCFPSPDPS